MTREEQLACLKDRPCDVCKKWTDKGCSSWGCVFEQEPEDESTCNREQEPCEDCISRDGARQAYKHAVVTGNMTTMINDIESLPSVNPAKRVGRWIELKDGYDDEYYECTICGTPLDTIVGTPDDNGFNFCPFCGSYNGGYK